MSPPPPSDRPEAFRRHAVDGELRAITRAVAVEAPVAIEIDGLGYAVLMASPGDLVDLATGFALAERLVDRAAQILDIDVHATGEGQIVRIALAAECRPRAIERVRHRVSESSCGLCGIENLAQALRPLPRRAAAPPPADRAIFAALAALPAHQPVARATGAVHAAAACDAGGAIRMAREDVGRHNAFDKLIGAMARDGLGWDGGFALLSSRCSYELVEKAALAGCPTLVTISAPTTLALKRARDAGVGLVVLARGDAILVAS